MHIHTKNMFLLNVFHLFSLWGKIRRKEIGQFGSALNLYEFILNYVHNCGKPYIKTESLESRKAL